MRKIIGLFLPLLHTHALVTARHHSWALSLLPPLEPQVSRVADITPAESLQELFLCAGQSSSAQMADGDQQERRSPIPLQHDEATSMDVQQAAPAAAAEPQRASDAAPAFPATFQPGGAAAAPQAPLLPVAGSTMTQPRRSLDAMPLAVIRRILNALPIESKFQLGSVCRTLAAAVRSPEGAPNTASFQLSPTCAELEASLARAVRRSCRGTWWRCSCCAQTRPRR